MALNTYSGRAVFPRIKSIYNIYILKINKISVPSQMKEGNKLLFTKAQYFSLQHTIYENAETYPAVPAMFSQTN